MIQRPWTLVSSFVMLASVGFFACSSADTPEDDGTGGSSSGGSTATGGASTGGSATGGSATGGSATGGSATGGSGGSGGSTGTNTDPECKGIRTNMACSIEGKECPNLVCGLADSGTRSCNCATNWTCTACDFTNSWIKDRPADIQPCPGDAADEVSCLTNMQVCGPVGSEYCACYMDATDGLIWDCDSPPSSWM